MNIIAVKIMFLLYVIGTIFYTQHNVNSNITVIERTIYTDLMNISMNATNFSKNEIDY